MQEPTATGPNGQKIVYRNGKWQPLTGAAPQQRAPINTGVNPSVITQRDAQAQRREEFQYRQQRDATEDARKNQEQSEKTAKLASAQEDAAYQLSNVIEKIGKLRADVKDNSWFPGLGETGWLGARLGSIEGTPAYSLRKDLGTVDATQVLQAMTRLKELSPTGSTGFGALSAPELELLKSSVARLDPNMDQETFLANLDQAEKVYKDMLARIQGSSKPAPKAAPKAAPKRPADIDALMKKYGNR